MKILGNVGRTRAPGILPVTGWRGGPTVLGMVRKNFFKIFTIIVVDFIHHMFYKGESSWENAGKNVGVPEETVLEKYHLCRGPGRRNNKACKGRVLQELME